MTGYKLLFEQTVRPVVVCKKPYYTTVTGHYDEHVTVIRLTMKLLTDDGQNTAVLATHIGKVTQVIETVDSSDTQHRPSNFSIRAFSSG